MNKLTIGSNYLKLKYCLPGQGYNVRLPRAYRSITIHTTNGNAGSSFEAEAKFLATSKDVGAHYLVGKQGQVENIVPLAFQAYHTGKTKNNALYANSVAIGIEVHFTPKEGEWTAEQWYALTALVRTLPRIELVTHREIAIPKGRKIDPSGVTDNEFRFWKQNIDKEWVIITLNSNRVNYRRLPVLDKNNIITVLSAGKRFIAFPTPGESVNGNAVWYATPEGYIHSSVIKV